MNGMMKNTPTQGQADDIAKHRNGLFENIVKIIGSLGKFDNLMNMVEVMTTFKMNHDNLL